jgi:Flp pilus assembly protein TadB
MKRLLRGVAQTMSGRLRHEDGWQAIHPNIQILSGKNMESVAGARREVALEIQKLAEDFEKSDEAALHRTRIVCWVVVAVVTVIILILLLMGGDWRYLGFFWVVIVGLTWTGYALSSRRQRQQTGRLRALATRWLNGEPPATG